MIPFLLESRVAFCSSLNRRRQLVWRHGCASEPGPAERAAYSGFEGAKYWIFRLGTAGVLLLLLHVLEGSKLE